jgi:hypothetical protein
METKKCITCKIIKSIDEFYKHPKTKDKYSSKCKSCTKEYGNKYYTDIRKNPEKNNIRINNSLNRKLGLNEDNTYMYYKMFPEKCRAASTIRNRDFPKIKGSIYHHWSYNKKHYTDIIILTHSEHKIAHRYIIYDKERMMYRGINGILLDTKEDHLKYIKQYL